MTSGSALALNKLADIVDPVLETGLANAADKSGAAEKGTAYRYSQLLSPLMIGDKIVKNRMIHTVGSPPHFMQGPENFPADVSRIFYSRGERYCFLVR